MKLPNDFDKACAAFRGFLSSHGYCDNIVWIMPDDVLLTGKPFLYLRVSSSPCSERHCRELFLRAAAQNSGVLFSTFCEFEGFSTAECGFLRVKKKRIRQ